MGPGDFGAYRSLQWAVLIGCGGLICVLLFLIDPPAIPPAVILLAVAALVLFWTQERMLDRPDRSGGNAAIAELPPRPTAGDTVKSEPPSDPAAGPDPLPACSKCGFQSEIGDLKCPRCGAPLWDDPPE
jgi:hypothetical protein